MTALLESDRILQLNDNGAWSWFMDERTIVHAGKLLVGSVRSSSRRLEEGRGEPGWGNIEVAVHDLGTGTTAVRVLHEGLEQDDHDGPAFLIRSDGRVAAVYAKHSQERRVYWRISTDASGLSWGPERSLETPGRDHPPYGGDNVTYSNPFLLGEAGKALNFFRGPGHQQNWLASDDEGETWRYGGGFVHGRGGYAPYFKYCAAPDGAIQFVGTEDHPRNFDNSVYHGVLRDGIVHHSDGRPFAPLSRTTAPAGMIWDLTRVFAGDPDNVAWVMDLHLDRNGHPVCLYSVQKDGRGLPPRQGGMDHRLHRARWNGERWVQCEIGHAGTRLYAFEDDYTGLAALDPRDPDTVVLSTDVHPASGKPLVSRADGRSHHELFLGRPAAGTTWAWEPLTADSTGDNLRPLIPIGPEGPLPVVWMRGRYLHNNGPWTTSVRLAFLAGRSTA